ncbi:MAG: agmatine deiminase family protein [Proteobacteria bacterium]|jgi:agmatine deiminase|nr:agmatine deiminase family protein [Pseudomonadota bacterium]
MPQSGIMLIWPHGHTDWNEDLAAVEAVYLQLAQGITSYEKLLVVCHSDAHLQHVSGCLNEAGISAHRVRYAVQPSNDTWARDSGPITVLEDGTARLLDFRFNGWAGKFEHDLDDRITAGLIAQGIFDNVPAEHVELVLEGGSIDSDGAGTLLTTTSCLLHPDRNPGLSRDELEIQLRHHLGVEHILWLQHGSLAGDDTDGHIDMLARFCDTGTLACSVCEDPTDENTPALSTMRAELAQLRQPDGQPYRLIDLPIPAPIYDEAGQRLPGSYANFLIINTAVLVPLYNDTNDAVAMAKLANAFPDREIIGIDCRPLIRQNGSLHCITMQLPASIPI